MLIGLVIVLLGPDVVKLSVTATSSLSDLPLLLSVTLVMEAFLGWDRLCSRISGQLVSKSALDLACAMLSLPGLLFSW